APSVASWNRGALLEVGLNEDAKISSVSLIPVILEDGLPRLEVTESNRFGSRCSETSDALPARRRLHSLSLRGSCVKINEPWLCDCRNRITRTLSASSSWILCAPRKRRR